MSFLPRLGDFLGELRRRRVFRVAACYAASGFVVVEVANNFFPPLHLPPWTTTLVAVLVVLGFPIAVGLAWAFQVTPEGVRRADELESAQHPDEPRGATPRRPGGSFAREPDDPRIAPRPNPRRALPIALSVASLLVLGGFLLRFSDGRAHMDAATVAVLPFSVAGSPDFAYLATGIVDLLGRNLDGGPGIRTLEAATVLRAVGAPETAFDPDEGLRLASSLGAGAFVIGTIHETAGRLRIHASLYEAEGTEEPASQAAAEGSPEELFALVDRVSAQLLAHRRSGGFSSQSARSAAITTGSLEAFRAYLAAEEAFRVADMSPAVEGYQRAIAADSGFALAYYRLASAYWWSSLSSAYSRAVELRQLSREAAERAAALSRRLADRERRLVEAFAALHRGQADFAEERYRAFLEDYPDDVEARFQLADLLHHYNAPRGRPLAEAGVQFQRVLAGDPEFACPI